MAGNAIGGTHPEEATSIPGTTEAETTGGPRDPGLTCGMVRHGREPLHFQGHCVTTNMEQAMEYHPTMLPRHRKVTAVVVLRSKYVC